MSSKWIWYFSSVTFGIIYSVAKKKEKKEWIIKKGENASESQESTLEGFFVFFLLAFLEKGWKCFMFFFNLNLLIIVTNHLYFYLPFYYIFLFAFNVVFFFIIQVPFYSTYLCSNGFLSAMSQLIWFHYSGRK